MMKSKLLTLTLALVVVDLSSYLNLARSQFSANQSIVSQRQRPLIGSGRPRGEELGDAGSQNRPPVGGRRPPHERREPAGIGRPPVGGRPPQEERKPAGTRSECFDTDIVEHFTPLLPIAVSDSGFSGLTLTRHPTFWFYIPYKNTNISYGYFSLKNQNNTVIYDTHLKLPETRGFVRINLPTNQKALEKNQQYHWKFIIYCQNEDPNDLSKNVQHHGVITRVELTELEAKLEEVTLEKRLNFHIEHNLWYDASTDLDKIRDRPHTWRKLLKAIELENLAQEQIAGSALAIEESEF